MHVLVPEIENKFNKDVNSEFSFFFAVKKIRAVDVLLFGWQPQPRSGTLSYSV